MRSLKQRLLIAPVLVAGAFVVPATANAQTTYIGCAGTGSTVKPRVAPSTCSTWYPWVDHAHSHNFRRLHWHRWGASQATASGTDVYRGMGVVVRSPVRVTVSRPRGFDAWGGGVNLPAYSRMTVRYRDGSSQTVSLAWGFDLWPDY